VPAYFFVGGTAGLAAVIAFVAAAANADPSIHRAALWVAAAGAVLSPPLLISDLGRPARFLYMLRVFKRQSAMSVGVWALVVFSAAVFTALGADWLARDTPSFVVVPAIGAAAGLVAALTGLVLATYTGVLLGATAVPVWARNRRLLPLHFGASSLGAAVACVEILAGFVPVLNLIGVTAAVVETCLGVMHERRRLADTGSGASDHEHLGPSVRLGHLLSGAIPLALRLLAATSPVFRAIAAGSAIAGSLTSRYGWLAAGRRSAVAACETVASGQ
jgi:hypothetical protein